MENSTMTGEAIARVGEGFASAGERIGLKLEYLSTLTKLKYSEPGGVERKELVDRLSLTMDSIEADLGISKPEKINVGDLTVNLSCEVAPFLSESIEQVSRGIAKKIDDELQKMTGITNKIE